MFDGELLTVLKTAGGSFRANPNAQVSIDGFPPVELAAQAFPYRLFIGAAATHALAVNSSLGRVVSADAGWPLYIRTRGKTESVSFHAPKCRFPFKHGWSV